MGNVPVFDEWPAADGMNYAAGSQKRLQRQHADGQPLSVVVQWRIGMGAYVRGKIQGADVGRAVWRKGGKPLLLVWCIARKDGRAGMDGGGNVPEGVHQLQGSTLAVQRLWLEMKTGCKNNAARCTGREVAFRLCSPLKNAAVNKHFLPSAGDKTSSVPSACSVPAPIFNQRKKKEKRACLQALKPVQDAAW